MAQFLADGRAATLQPPRRAHRRARSPEVVEETIPRSWIRSHQRSGNLRSTTDRDLVAEARGFLGWTIPMVGAEFVQVETRILEDE